MRVALVVAFCAAGAAAQAAPRAARPSGDAMGPAGLEELLRSGPVVSFAPAGRATSLRRGAVSPALAMMMRDDDAMGGPPVSLLGLLRGLVGAAADAADAADSPCGQHAADEASAEHGPVVARSIMRGMSGATVHTAVRTEHADGTVIASDD